MPGGLAPSLFGLVLQHLDDEQNPQTQVDGQDQVIHRDNLGL